MELQLGRKVKIGLVGCGSALGMHMATGKYLSNGEFTAVMDTNEARVKRAMEQYGIKKGYTAYNKFLTESGVDAVIIVTPPAFHCEMTILAAKHKKHVLCEKPMAPSIAECRMMKTACEENGVNLMVGFMKRFDKTMNKVDEIIRSGELGSIYQISTLWSWWQIESAIDWRDTMSNTYGGLYQDHGSHVTDLCRWWIGEIDHVSAEINVIKDGREVEDNAVVTYKHKNGAVSVHMQSRMTNCELTERYLIDGRKGSLELSFNNFWSGYSPSPFNMYLHKGGKCRENLTVERDGNMDVEITRSGKFKNEIDYFCRCILDGVQPEINTAYDGEKAIEAINAAYLSSYLGEKISLPLAPQHETMEFRKIFAGIRVKSPQF